MSQTFYPKVVQQLKEAGYELVRHGKGSHQVFGKKDSQPIVVSVNIRDKNLAKQILKKAGLRL